MKRTPLQRKAPLRAKTPLKAKAALRNRKPLQRPRRPLAERSGKVYKPTWQAQVTLAKYGRRARRLAPGDRAMEREVHAMPCICGCSADPAQGEVARAHLIGRGAESTRNAVFNNLPACLPLSEWLDHHHMGVQAKALLKQMALHKWEHHKERLAHSEVWPVLDGHGYYGWRGAKYGC